MHNSLKIFFSINFLKAWHFTGSSVLSSSPLMHTTPSLLNWQKRLNNAGGKKKYLRKCNEGKEREKKKTSTFEIISTFFSAQYTRGLQVPLARCEFCPICNLFCLHSPNAGFLSSCGASQAHFDTITKKKSGVIPVHQPHRLGGSWLYGVMNRNNSVFLFFFLLRHLQMCACSQEPGWILPQNHREIASQCGGFRTTVAEGPCFGHSC